MLVASPPWTKYSQLQRLRKSEITKSELEEAQSLLHLAVRSCRKQYDEGEFFLFEHPRSASSWQDEKLKDLCSLAGVDCIDLDMCRFDLRSRDASGEGLCLKPTRIVTNLRSARDLLGLR